MGSSGPVYMYYEPVISNLLKPEGGSFGLMDHCGSMWEMFGESAICAAHVVDAFLKMV